MYGKPVTGKTSTGENQYRETFMGGNQKRGKALNGISVEGKTSKGENMLWGK